MLLTPLVEVTLSWMLLLRALLPYHRAVEDSHRVQVQTHHLGH